MPTRTHIVHGVPMHVRETGAGDPILCLHGNPTSSWLWRNVMPDLAHRGHGIAVDLVGMGESGAPPVAAGFLDHARYLEGLLDTLALDPLVIVAHDWGVALGIHYARRHPERVRALAMMEGHLAPIPAWDDFDEGGRDLFHRLRDPGIGHRLIVEENIFIEAVLPSGIQRSLTDDEMAGYRAPFLEPARREAIRRWVGEIPIAGEPPDVHQAFNDNVAFLRSSSIPKLLLHGQPGAIVDAVRIAWARETIANLTVIDVGPGLHFLPEDRPTEIAAAIDVWLG